jgi:hypothetical protein
MMQRQYNTNMSRIVLLFEEGNEKGHKTIQKVPVVDGSYNTALHMMIYTFSILKKRQQSGAGG